MVIYYIAVSAVSSKHTEQHTYWTPHPVLATWGHPAKISTHCSQPEEGDDIIHHRFIAYHLG